MEQKIIPTARDIKEHLRHARQEIAKLENEIRAEHESAATTLERAQRTISDQKKKAIQLQGILQEVVANLDITESQMRLLKTKTRSKETALQETGSIRQTILETEAKIE